MEISPHKQRVLKKLPPILAATAMGNGNIAMLDELVNIEEKIEELEEKLDTAVIEVKARQGDPGKNADENKIIDIVLSRIPVPENGKDADEKKITKTILKKLPKPLAFDYDSLVERVLNEIPIPEPAPEIIPLRATELRDMLEALPEEERMRRSALLGGDDMVDREELNRAIEILDKRTQYLINKVVTSGAVTSLTTIGTSGAATLVNGVLNIPQYASSGSGTQIEQATGTCNGVNTAFTVTVTPVYMIADGLAKYATVDYTVSGLNITWINGAPPTQNLYSVHN